MSLSATDVAREISCHRNFALRILTQRHADGVSDAIAEQCADAHSALDASVLTLAGFGNAKM